MTSPSDRLARRRRDARTWHHPIFSVWLAGVLAASGACGGGGGGGAGTSAAKCQIPAGTTAAPDFLHTLGCAGDFVALASAPLDATIPGARSGKVILDTTDHALYFQNSTTYKIHYDFASKFLSAPAHPVVPPLAEFNQTEYYASADLRRFLLGALTHYESADIWALEIAPYDTATADMIVTLFNAVAKATFMGGTLVFHPTSEAVEAVAKGLPASIPVKTNDDIFAKIAYQPLNLGTTVGTLRFVQAAALDATYVGFRDIVVLDHVPNDVSVVAGLITEEFQTPLSHVNVLAQNRGTPNMGLRDATTNPALRALEGKWVSLTVGALDWSVREATVAEADAWWEAHKPAPIILPSIDLTARDLKNVEDLVDESGLPASKVGLLGAISQAILAYGTKASNYGVLANTVDVPVRKGFAIPIFYYVQFMQQNGFFDQVDALLADPTFVADPAVRDAKLAELRNAILTAPVDPEFQALLKAKLDAEYPGLTMRFRTSTNAEDLDGFPCAGCYDSHTGDPASWISDSADCHVNGQKDCGILQAIRWAWSGVWYFRTFEERSYHGIDHKSVGMGLLVHHNFPDEEANGVAVTANPFDSSGLEPAFYVNVQRGGEAAVVAPPLGVTSDQFLFFYGQQGTPVTYLGHSNLLLPSEPSVLAPAQILELGTALDAIHRRFSPAYGPLGGSTAWYGMDVEFKFDDEDNPGMPAHLIVKQARPYHGRGQ